MARKPINKCTPNKPSFFKVLFGDFSKRLLIPPDFTKNFIWNGRSPHECALRGPSGQCWAVELKRTENGLFFQNGWQCFVKDHHLELGDFLIFRHDGESKFNVIIYDRSACEKDVKVAKRRMNCSVCLRNNGNQARVKDEVLDLVTENNKNIDSRGEAVVADEKGNDVMSGKRPANGYLEETSDGSILFKSENPCFQRILTKHSKYHIGFPKELGVAKGLMNKKTMKLEDPTGRSWPVSLRLSKFYKKDARLYDRLDLTSGWSQICEANKISPGDTIIFELVKQRVMKIHIIEVGRMRGKGCAVKLVAPNVKSSI
ncbi:putative B3 domain-containing protein Os03g0621600 [Rosa chinensis]|uniref:putative B3 domain-containing protein Os03g0621600 n=1 Tax=Rosa chinensis TaxID=74649 RepID=UPI001AD8AD65|nr:putative B3 domain-containing protein Os03g0621600 [Rosa chinensis]